MDILPAACIEDAPRFADFVTEDSSGAWYLSEFYTYATNSFNLFYFNSTDALYTYFGDTLPTSYIFTDLNTSAAVLGDDFFYDRGGNVYLINGQPFSVWEAYHQSIQGAKPVYSTLNGVNISQYVQRGTQGGYPQFVEKMLKDHLFFNLSLFYNATENPNLNFSTINRSDPRVTDYTLDFLGFLSSTETNVWSTNTSAEIQAEIAALFFGTAGPVTEDTKITIAGYVGPRTNARTESQTMSYNGIYGFRKTICEGWMPNSYNLGDEVGGAIHHLWLTDDANALHQFPVDEEYTDFDQLRISAGYSAAVVTYYSINPGCGGDAAHEAYFQELAMYRNLVGTECVSAPNTTTTPTTTNSTTNSTVNSAHAAGVSVLALVTFLAMA